MIQGFGEKVGSSNWKGPLWPQTRDGAQEPMFWIGQVEISCQQLHSQVVGLRISIYILPWCQGEPEREAGSTRQALTVALQGVEAATTSPD